MGNLIEIRSQIERLQKQAADIKSREFGKTVKQILAMMEAFDITLKDLQQEAGKTRDARAKAAKALPKKGVSKIGKVFVNKAARKPSSQKGVKVLPKYRGPKGETWSGRGMMPRWMAALAAQGKTRESFAV
jgi:DNA-binding protein H-NS